MSSSLGSHDALAHWRVWSEHPGAEAKVTGAVARGCRAVVVEVTGTVVEVRESPVVAVVVTTRKIPQVRLTYFAPYKKLHNQVVTCNERSTKPELALRRLRQ